MNCLPLPKCIKRFGRALSKMFPSRKESSGWQKLSDKENMPFDHYSSYFSAPSPPKTDPHHTYAIPTYLNGHNDCPESGSSSSSGYGSWSISQSSSPAKNDFNIFKDNSSASFMSLLSPIQTIPLENQTFNCQEYSPMSSYAFYSSELYSEDFTSSCSIEEQSKHDEIRREFEMNGRTMEMDPGFVPPVSSTPMMNRRPMSYFQPQRNIQEFEKSRKNFIKKKFKPHKKSLNDHCVFCKNNGEDERVYRNHTVKDAMGRVLCPQLRLYKCPICGEDGDKSHTVKYCPMKPIITLEDLERMENKA